MIRTGCDWNIKNRLSASTALMMIDTIHVSDVRANFSFFFRFGLEDQAALLKPYQLPHRQRDEIKINYEIKPCFMRQICGKLLSGRCRVDGIKRVDEKKTENDSRAAMESCKSS